MSYLYERAFINKFEMFRFFFFTFNEGTSLDNQSCFYCFVCEETHFFIIIVFVFPILTWTNWVRSWAVGIIIQSNSNMFRSCSFLFQVISKLYTNTSTLSWNGNQVNGQDAITKFYDNLPGSHHFVANVDAQPLTSKGVD